MFQPIPVFEENIFAYKVSGKLTAADYQEFLPKLTTLIHKYGPLSLLLELDDFHGLEPKAAWEDFKFSTAHDKDFKKIAIVGDKNWEQWMVVLASTLSKTKFRYFEKDNAQQAWDWLRESNTQSDKAFEIKEQHQEVTPYRHILVATDYSLYSEKALLRALKLSQLHDARLTILHAIEQLGYYGDTHMMLAIPTFDHSIEKDIFRSSQNHMNSIKEKLGIANVHSEVIWGSAKTTILSYAEAQQVDLIVMGSHGRRGIAKLIGSTTNGVINNARCDVLSVS